MEQKNMSIVYSSSLTDIVSCNDSFDKGVLRVCYTGKSRNNTYISKETFERCMSTIYNVPVVCRYDRENDEIGSHDVDVVYSDNGDVAIVNLTHPVGVVPESAKPYWCTLTEDDGATHEYLCTEVLLWKRQEAYRKIKENGVTDESMEITINDGGMEDGVYVINDFEFTAFCLLGTDEPCFESAALITFSKKELQNEFDDMMRDFKKCFSVQTSNDDSDISTDFDLKGGNDGLDEKQKLMADFGFTEDQLDFKLEDFSIEELTEKFNQLKAEKELEDKKNFELSSNLSEVLEQSLRSETIKTEYGEYPRYFFIDYDPAVSMIYCEDREDWKLYGMTYSMNGDNAVIDFNSRKRMKYSIVEFDEGEQPSSGEAMFSYFQEAVKKINADWQEKYSAVESQNSEMNTELDELRKFKSSTEEAKLTEQREAILNKFADLDGVEAFEKLREEAAKYSLEDLEEKCFAQRGRHQSMKFNREDGKSIKLKVEQKPTQEKAKMPYNGIFEEYGIV